MQGNGSLERQLLEGVLRNPPPVSILIFVSCLFLSYMRVFSTEDRSLGKHSQHRMGPGLIKTHPVPRRMQLHFLPMPQLNFLWISDHLLFPIILPFTLSIWRIQMLNDERRMRGEEKIPFCLKDKILQMPPRSASPKRSSTWQRLAQLSLCQMII
jgi:hypothetical protein